MDGLRRMIGGLVGADLSRIDDETLACMCASGSLLFSMMSDDRISLVRRMVLRTRDVAGDWVEMGCLHGGTTAFVATLCRMRGIQRGFWVYDTFCGFPEIVDGRDVPEFAEVMFKDADVGFVRSYLRRVTRRRATVVEGDIRETLASSRPESVALLLVDCDIASFAMGCMDHVWPLLSEGHVIMVDDVDESETAQFPGMFRRFVPMLLGRGYRQVGVSGGLRAYSLV